jgi:anti-sigma regulatory factor (Ser/Thr protein kinase)
MSEEPAILAFFSDKAVRRKWEPILTKFPGAIVTCCNDHLGRLDPAILDLAPRMAFISLDLYSDKEREIIRKLHIQIPNLQIVILTSNPIPQSPFQSLMLDNIRHCAIMDPTKETDQIGALFHAIMKDEPLNFHPYFKSNLEYHEFSLIDPREKESIISKLEQLVFGAAQDLEFLRLRSALLADEMIENAIEAAPDGVIPQKGILIKVGFDGETLMLQVKDSWGTLTPEKTLEHLARPYDNASYVNMKRGRGLFILWHFFERFHISINAGKETAIGGQLKRTLAPAAGRLKRFDFFHLSPSGRSHSLSLYNSVGGYAHV